MKNRRLLTNIFTNYLKREMKNELQYLPRIKLGMSMKLFGIFEEKTNKIQNIQSFVFSSN